MHIGVKLGSYDFSKKGFNRSTIVDTSAIAPLPVSPHINIFDIQGISVYPQDLSLLICSYVRGWSYIRVFIAGQKSNGLWRSQARTTQVSKLSHIP